VSCSNVEGVFTIDPTPYNHPDVARLVDELQAEYMQIYGQHDETPVDDGEFDPPLGLFLVGRLDGEPVAAGGWRRIDGVTSTGEIKRMYVVERSRGRGLSRLMLAELESTLAEAGCERVVLMTGQPQRAAIALYESSGYEPTEAYGIYACYADARFYGKELGAAAAMHDRAGTEGLARRG
jgi:GNAT superfamily N-acetyltransferase